MKRTLFMTVGIGGRSEEKVYSLAHGLLESILHYKPDFIIFFGSYLSENTVESIKEQYKERSGSDLDDYQFITIAEADRFEECFQKIRQEILNHPNEEIIIDYTSGTKTMTMSAAIASVLYHKKLTLVSGERGENGLVLSCTEEIKTQSLYSVYDELLMGKLKEAFNQYRFETALGILKEMVHVENREDYQNLLKAYNHWDKFNHQDAFDLIKKIDSSQGDEKSFAMNKEFIGTLVNSRNLKEFYLLADLIKNAQRRCQEGKYDDAVARLYRAVEFIAQTRLKKEYNIDTSDVNLERVPAFAREQYQKRKEGKRPIGLREGYKLLRQLGDDVGCGFFNDKRLMDLLYMRNSSILAHGFQPITREKLGEVKELADKTIQMASVIYPDLEDWMMKAEFMKL